MEAYRILAQGALSPEVLAVLYDAFDAAWAELEPEVGADPIAAARARERLARAILSLSQEAVVDRELIKVSALAIMRAKT